jgi:transposase InsO family protein
MSIDGVLDLYGLHRSTYYGWFDGNGNLRPPKERKVTNDRRVLDKEVQAVLAYRALHKEVGYRKLTWMMIDENIACLAESAVYQVLSEHGMLYGWASPDSEGTEKEYKHKPRYPHHHWHTDIAYIKIQGVFYFLIMLLDGYSRYLLAWELMTDMLGTSVENFIAKNKEKYPFAKPKLIHDNGGQFVSHDFKKLMTTLEIQSVHTRRNHPQTNGKIERMNGTVKSEAIRPNAPADYQEAVQILNEYSYTYNHQRLHAGIEFLRPADLFFGRKEKILKERSEKIIHARKSRREINKNAASQLASTMQ